VASSGYNFVRWLGGAVAPFAAAQLAEHFGSPVAFYTAAAAVVISLLIAGTGRKYLTAHAPHGV
jgi:dipeptide/tripeptide permease